MNKNELLNILYDWNIWKKDLNLGLLRNRYLEKIPRLLASPHILAITGPRRAGKSFFMSQIMNLLIERDVKKANLLIINFEDPRFPNLDTDFLQYIFETYVEVLNPSGEIFIFFDEIQEVENWEKWVNYMHELKKARFIVSGSNAKLLSKELGTLLTGRHLDLTIFPLSFKEFLGFKDKKIPNLEDPLDIIDKRMDMKILLNEYIEYGGYPEIILSEPKHEMLLRYIDDIINKDILRRHNIKQQEALKAIVKWCFSNISSLITFRSISRLLNINQETAEKFLGFLEDAYCVFFLRRFSFKVKEQEKSPRKIYSIDTGLSNTLGFRFSDNIGRLIENVVFLHLKRLELNNSDMELFYWKDETHKEVDFVIKQGLRVKSLIQVCWNIDNARTKKREITSLLKAMRELNIDTGIIITEAKEEEENVDGKIIKYIPLWKWLLEK